MKPPIRRLEYTGERMVPWAPDFRVVYEHLHRYHFAAGLAAGRRVLDLGSGEGYGAAILAKTAAQVVALEIDQAAVVHGRDRYQTANLVFDQGSVLDLSRYAVDSFDLVVCFEVVEHVTDQAELVKGIRRVLRPDGLFIASTPNREVYNETLAAPNEFHVRELDEKELIELLRPDFPNLAVWGQRLAVGSEIMRRGGDDEHHADEDQVPTRIAVRRQGDDWLKSASSPDVYLVCVASACPLPTLPDLSLLVDTDLALIREYEVLASGEVAILRARAETAERTLAAMRASRGWRLLETASRVARPLCRPLRPPN